MILFFLILFFSESLSANVDCNDLRNRAFIKALLEAHSAMDKVQARQGLMALPAPYRDFILRALDDLGLLEHHERENLSALTGIVDRRHYREIYTYTKEDVGHNFLQTVSLFYLKYADLEKLSEGQVAIAFHHYLEPAKRHEAYSWVLWGKRVKELKGPGGFVSAIPDSALQFVSKNYLKRLKHLKKNDVNDLLKISQDMQDRSIYFILSDNGPDGFAHIDLGPKKLAGINEGPIKKRVYTTATLEEKLAQKRAITEKDLEQEARKFFEATQANPFTQISYDEILKSTRKMHKSSIKKLESLLEETRKNGPVIFEYHESPMLARNHRIQGPLEKPQIRGVLISVVSHSEKELLPVEALMDKIAPGFRIERPAKGSVVELGRFAVDSKGGQDALTLMKMSASMMSSSHNDVAKIVIQVDEAHRRLFKPLGFKTLKSFEGIQGREYILEIDPKDLFQGLQKMGNIM